MSDDKPARKGSKIMDGIFLLMTPEKQKVLYILLPGLVLLFMLVGIASFMLGRMSVLGF